MSDTVDRIASYAAARLYNRGTRALDVDDPHASQRALLASLACAPYTAQTWLNLGNALMQQGDAHAALGMYRRAMSLENHPRGAVNAAIALLTLGQWEEGWKMYEQRFALPEFQKRNGLKGGDESKMWDGSPLNGRKLLIFNEQGVGDSIMMLRYAFNLAVHNDVTVRVPASMLRLVRAAFPWLSLGVVTDSEPVPEHDVFVPFMSLPYHLRPPIDTAPRDAYLSTRENEPPLEIAKMPWQTAPLRIGVVWAGNPNHKGDHRRSIPFGTFAPLLDAMNVTIASLQVGERASDVDAPAFYAIHRAKPIDFYDTARWLKALDLLISVDTSTAHLAGALGVPTWLLLPFAADFRWGQHSETTPWYSSMRLFRQTNAGDWSSVLERVRTELASLVSTRNAA
jgi:hypothetical protein